MSGFLPAFNNLLRHWNNGHDIRGNAILWRHLFSMITNSYWFWEPHFGTSCCLLIGERLHVWATWTGCWQQPSNQMPWPLVFWAFARMLFNLEFPHLEGPAGKLKSAQASTPWEALSSFIWMSFQLGFVRLYYDCSVTCLTPPLAHNPLKAWCLCPQSSVNRRGLSIA